MWIRGCQTRITIRDFAAYGRSVMHSQKMKPIPSG
jgi:hypothetical protein